MIRISISAATVAILLTAGSAVALATDHLSHANNTPGVDDRGFTNAVNNNPGAGERSPNAGNPAAKPQGFGDPKEGTQTGTPSSSNGIGND